MSKSKLTEGVRIVAGLNQRPDILSLLGPPPFENGKGAYIATAIFGCGIAHPCKFSPKWDQPIRVEDDGAVWQFFGKYSVLRLTDDMEWVEASRGKTPPGQRPVKGGVNKDGEALFHAAAVIGDKQIPGMVCPSMHGASFIWKGRVYILPRQYTILCWKLGMEPSEPFDPNPGVHTAPTSKPEPELEPTPGPTSDKPVKTAYAMIEHDIDGPAIYSKYRVELKFPQEIAIHGLTLNINSDLALNPFSSDGAPSLYNLVVTYRGFEDIVGHGKFSGTIGGGKITIRLRSGAVIMGTIRNGPKMSASFVGSGTWLMP